jgi:hypothetical protein
MTPFSGGRREGLRNAGLETVGIVVRVPLAHEFDEVRAGRAATVVARVRCGECDGEWDAAFPPAGKKTSVCPHCGALNRMFSGWTVV